VAIGSDTPDILQILADVHAGKMRLRRGKRPQEPRLERGPLFVRLIGGSN